MASEQTKSFRLSVSKNGDSVGIVCDTSQDMAGLQMSNMTQPIGTGGTDTLNFGAVTKVGATLVVKNLDAAAVITLGLASGVAAPFASIPPLDFAKIVVPTGVTNIYAKSTVAAAQIAVCCHDA